MPPWIGIRNLAFSNLVVSTCLITGSLLWAERTGLVPVTGSFVWAERRVWYMCLSQLMYKCVLLVFMWCTDAMQCHDELKQNLLAESSYRVGMQ